MVVFGAAAALLGAVMCVLQPHIKRLLAYSTISHVGMLLVGLEILRDAAPAGASWYLLGHAGVKAALFVGAGALLNQYETVDEHDLHGRSRSIPMVGLIFLLGSLDLAGLPPSGTSVGKAVIEEAGGPWVPILAIIASALTARAALHRLHSGHVGDYVAWLVAGVTVFGLLLAT